MSLSSSSSSESSSIVMLNKHRGLPEDDPFTDETSDQHMITLRLLDGDSLSSDTTAKPQRGGSISMIQDLFSNRQEMTKKKGGDKDSNLKSTSMREEILSNCSGVFDQVLESSASQEEVYNAAISSLVQRFLGGKSGSLITYGQEKCSSVSGIFGGKDGILQYLVRDLLQATRFPMDDSNKNLYDDCTERMLQVKVSLIETIFNGAQQSSPASTSTDEAYYQIHKVSEWMNCTSVQVIIKLIENALSDNSKIYNPLLSFRIISSTDDANERIVSDDYATLSLAGLVQFDGTGENNDLHQTMKREGLQLKDLLSDLKWRVAMESYILDSAEQKDCMTSFLLLASELYSKKKTTQETLALVQILRASNGVLGNLKAKSDTIGTNEFSDELHIGPMDYTNILSQEGIQLESNISNDLSLSPCNSLIDLEVDDLTLSSEVDVQKVKSESEFRESDFTDTVQDAAELDVENEAEPRNNSRVDVEEEVTTLASKGSQTSRENSSRHRFVGLGQHLYQTELRNQSVSRDEGEDVDRGDEQSLKADEHVGKIESTPSPSKQANKTKSSFSIWWIMICFVGMWWSFVSFSSVGDLPHANEVSKVIDGVFSQPVNSTSPNYDYLHRDDAIMRFGCIGESISVEKSEHVAPPPSSRKSSITMYNVLIGLVSIIMFHKFYSAKKEEETENAETGINEKKETELAFLTPSPKRKLVRDLSSLERNNIFCSSFEREIVSKDGSIQKVKRSSRLLFSPEFKRNVNNSNVRRNSKQIIKLEK